MKNTIKKNNSSVYGFCLLVIFLIVCEIHQFISISNFGYLGGDFTMPVPDQYFIKPALTLSILSWLCVLAVFIIFRSTKQGLINIPFNNAILCIYAFNFIITYYLDIGLVGAEKSKLGFLLTLVPIGYLFFINSQTEKLSLRFYLAALFLVLTDLVRSLLEAILKVGYVIFLRINSTKKIILGFLALPLLIYISTQLIQYKLKERGLNPNIIDQVQTNEVIISRISTISTFTYGLSYSQPLSKVYITEEYGSIWKSAFLALIPKGIFGIVPPKTWNNALIEFYLGKDVPDSSVNSPLILNLYLLSIGSFEKLLSYFFLISVCMFTTLKLANILLGIHGEPFKFYIIFQFFWTGNILHLLIPLYFVVMLYLIQKSTKLFIKRKHENKN